MVAEQTENYLSIHASTNKPPRPSDPSPCLVCRSKRLLQCDRSSPPARGPVGSGCISHRCTALRSYQSRRPGKHRSDRSSSSSKVRRYGSTWCSIRTRCKRQHWPGCRLPPPILTATESLFVALGLPRSGCVSSDSYALIFLSLT